MRFGLFLASFLAFASCGGAAFAATPSCEDSQRFDPPRTFRGVWATAFEASAFFEGRTTVPPPDERQADGYTWLSFSRESGRPENLDADCVDLPCGYEVEFVGCRVSAPGRYGHMGGYRYLVVVDRLVSFRRITNR